MSQTEPPAEPALARPPGATPDPGFARRAAASTLIVPVRSAEHQDEGTPHGLPAYWPSDRLPSMRWLRPIGFLVALASVGAAGVAVGRYWSHGDGVPVAAPDAALSMAAMPAAASAFVASPAPRVDSVDLSRVGVPGPRGDVRTSIVVTRGADSVARAATVAAPVAAPASRRRRPRTARVAARIPSGDSARDRAPDGLSVRSVAEVMIASYAAAIEARDANRLARAYPALSPSERAGWEKFFRDVRAVDARLEIRDFRVLDGGQVAEANVVGSYDYESVAGSRGSQPAHFRALFGREPVGAWRLVAIR